MSTEVELRQQIASLEAELAYYRAFFAAAPTGMVIQDRELRFLSANPFLADVDGKSVEEHLGKTLNEIAPAIAARIEPLYQRTLDSGEPVTWEIRSGVFPGATRVRDWSISLFQLCDDQGLALGVGTLMVDNTERKNAESELEQSRRMLQLVIDLIPSTIFWKDKDLVYLGCNLAFARDAGRTSPEEMIGKTDFDMPWKDLAPLFRADDAQVIASGMPKLGIEEPLIKADGSQSWLRTSKIPLPGPNGEIIGVLCTYEDVTERKQAEMERERLIAILDNSRDFIGLTDPAGKIIYINAAGARMMGCDSPEELIGQRVPEMESDDADDLMKQEILPAVFQKGIWHGENMLRRMDGKSIPVDLTIFAIQDEQGQPQAIATIMTNITERKQAEEEKERLHQQIIDAQRQALQELSTPIIPIMDRIIVMPLIGSIDTLRSRDITRSLLHGISDYRAKIVILDVTGVPLVDSGVASYLDKTIQAARLKGARTIVTGVSDAVAETIVDLGIDWSGIETLRDLQTGLITALESLGIRLSR